MAYYQVKLYKYINDKHFYHYNYFDDQNIYFKAVGELKNL